MAINNNSFEATLEFKILRRWFEEGCTDFTFPQKVGQYQFQELVNWGTAISATRHYALPEELWKAPMLFARYTHKKTGEMTEVSINLSTVKEFIDAYNLNALEMENWGTPILNSITPMWTWAKSCIRSWWKHTNYGDGRNLCHENTSGYYD